MLGVGSPSARVDDLYREHAVGLVRLAVLLVGDQATAEDVVQDAFIGLYRGWGRLRDPGNALGYLRTAVINGCRSVHRTRHRTWLRTPHDQPVWSAETAAIEGEERRAVLAAVARLPRRQREILALRFYPIDAVRELSELKVRQFAIGVRNIIIVANNVRHGNRSQ
jgi:RNA polymerase sigma factor (sigma-70 family)